MATIYRFTHHPKETKVHLVIVILTVLVTLIQFVMDGDAGGERPIAGSLGLFLPRAWEGEWWRMFSVSLVHGNGLHLLMNMWFIYVAGKLCEFIVGPIGLVIIYLSAVVGGSIAVMLFGDVFTSVVGASGGAYGLLGGLLAAGYVQTGSFRALAKSYIGSQLLLMLVINLLISLSPNISMLGHVGGLIGGMLTGYLIERYRQGSPTVTEKLSGVVLLAMIVGLAAYGHKPTHRGAWRLEEAKRIMRENVIELPNGEIAFPREAVAAAVALRNKGFGDIDTSALYEERKSRFLEELEKWENHLSISSETGDGRRRTTTIPESSPSVPAAPARDPK